MTYGPKTPPAPSPDRELSYSSKSPVEEPAAPSVEEPAAPSVEEPTAPPVQPNYVQARDSPDVYKKFGLRTPSPLEDYLPGATRKFTPEGPSPIDKYLPGGQPNAYDDSSPMDKYLPGSRTPPDPACERPKPTGGQVEPLFRNNSPQHPDLKPTLFEPRSPDETPPEEDDTASQSGAGLDEIELFPEKELDDANSLDISLDLNEVEI